MTKSKDPLPKVPPFILENKTQPRRNGVDTRGLLSVATLIVSMSAVTVSMGGAAKLVFDVFNEGLTNSLDGIWAKIIPLGIAFLFGWVVALVNIRAFGNLIYPIIIKIYAWACLAAINVLYIKIIQKLFMQKYDNQHFWAYLLILLGGLAVLMFLHLLIEGHDLRPFAVPLLIVSVLHIFVMVFRYVFTSDAQGTYLLGDLSIFIVMISISALMLMHLGILSSVRSNIDGIFSQNGNGNGKDNGHHWIG
jgi:hypothetical protein